MRPVLSSVPSDPSPRSRYLPALPRPRCDSAEFSLGYDAYVVFPDARPMPATLGTRLAHWSRRVRRILGEAGLRVVATLAVVGFAWLCERGGA
jgi:hypothetical protein